MPTNFGHKTLVHFTNYWTRITHKCHYQLPRKHIHLAKLIPKQFLKPAVCKYPTTVNNSEIYILLPKPCP